MECPYCHAINPEHARFCNNCGRELPQKCQNCSASLLPEARFCQNCGQAVPERSGARGSDIPGEETTQSRARESRLFSPTDSLQRYIPNELMEKLEAARRSHLMVGERRIVSILFCDVKGSTEAASKLDPEEWAEIINGAFEHMIQPVYRYEGTVARLMGDGLLAFFGAPIAHEDDPHRAILAGLDILQSVQDYGKGVEASWGIDFDVRVGINTGLVVVGAVGSDLRMEYSALGDAINIAARMEQTARPGSVQIAEATYKLVAPAFEVQPVEGLEIKGHEPVQAYRVLRRKEKAGSLRGIAGLSSPLVGRQTEMGTLEKTLAKLKEGIGGLISIIGEAGLGKSRLIAEFRQDLVGNGEDLQWLEGRSLSYDDSTPFALFANVFSEFFQLKRSTPDQEQYDQVGRRIESLLPGRADELAPFFATLLGIQLENEAAERVKYLEPPHLRGLIFEKVMDLLDEILSHRPAILFLDDLHWADPTSLELLETLLPLVDEKPFLVITSFRPELQFSQAFEQISASHQRKIMLTPFDDSQGRNLIANLLKIEDLPEKLRQVILQKSEGNPFYIEEVIRSLLDRGLVIQEEGHWQATKEIHDVALPDSLAGLITARLDNLDEKTRHILHSAAVLGREFTRDALGKVVESPEQIEPALNELKGWEIVLERSTSDGQAYLFKHVLTQEAAYNSVLLSNRRELHRRAAEAMIHTQPGAHAEIARHLLEARQVDKALPYLVQAGEQAAKAYAVAEAQTYFKQALEILQDQGETGLLRRAYEGLGGVYQFSSRFPEALEIYTKMLSVAEQAGDIPMQISAMNKLAGVKALGMGDFSQAEQYLDRAEQLSRGHGELSSIPENSLLRCQICTVRAEFDQVVVLMDEVVEIGQELGKPEDILLGLEHISYSLVILTRFDEAQEKAERALRLAREIGQKEQEANLLAFPLPMCNLRNGDLARAKQCLEQSLAIAEKIGLLGAKGEAGYLITEIARWQGEYEKAIKHGKEALEAVLPLEPYMPMTLVPILGSLGMVYLEITEAFRDEIKDFHNHALRLLESPMGRMGGGTAWADLALCALKLRDMKVVEEAVQQGLNYPNLFSRLERPRHLAAAALLALSKSEPEEAVRLAEGGCSYAEDRSMRYLYPFLFLVLGEIQVVKGEIEAGLKSLKRAEREASQLGMRPVLWQAQAAAGRALSSTGQVDEAEKKLEQARQSAMLIAERIRDQDLREAYQQNLTKGMRSLY
jgi:class 3 adenylate cyclase/tetratricopeptide (TPR) repeat protein